MFGSSIGLFVICPGSNSKSIMMHPSPLHWWLPTQHSDVGDDNLGDGSQGYCDHNRDSYYKNNYECERAFDFEDFGDGDYVTEGEDNEAPFGNNSDAVTESNGRGGDIFNQDENYDDDGKCSDKSEDALRSLEGHRRENYVIDDEDKESEDEEDDEDKDEEVNDDDDDDDDDDNDDDDAAPPSINAPHPTADDLRELNVTALKKMLAARGLLQQGRKEDLIQRILHPKDTDFKLKPKGEQWKNSKAKAFLTRLLMDKTSDVHGKSPEEVWQSSEWFQKYPKHRFVSNMTNLKTALEARGQIIEEDVRLIEAELAALNLSDMTKRGYPHWHTHAAKKLLAEDLIFGRNCGLKPKAFQITREEFKEFPLGVFRKHIYQENRKQREMPLKIAKRNKLAQKQYEQEVEAEAVRWHSACRATALNASTQVTV